MTLSQFVTEYRTEHGLSQRQFALACGVSNGYISMLEKNENPKTGMPLIPSIPALKKIAAGMGITLSDLFSKVDDMPVDLTAADEKKPDIESDDGLDGDIIQMFSRLPVDKKQEALNYLRYLANQEEKP